MFRKIAVGLICMASLAGVASAGSAGQTTNQGGIQGQQAGLPQLSLTWEQFKLSCLSPEHFNRQLPPSDITITCENKQTVWVQVNDGNFDLDQYRKIRGSVQSDKYFVPGQEFNAECPQGRGSCTRYKEVIRTYAMQRALSCDELQLQQQQGQGLGEDLGQTCQRILDEELPMNQQLIAEVDTGRTLDSCAAVHSSKGRNK